MRAMYPGTFDPVHFGHLNIMQRTAQLFDELVVGVYDHGRPIKSIVFAAEQRIDLISEALGPQPNIRLASYSGLTVDFAREVGAEVIVRGLRVFSDFEFEFRLALANNRLMPEIETVTLMTHEEHMFLSGTTVREIASMGGDVSSMVPPNVAAALDAFYGSHDGDDVHRSISLRD